MLNDQKVFEKGNEVIIVGGYHTGRTGVITMLAPYALYPISVMLNDETPKIDRIFREDELLQIQMETVTKKSACSSVGRAPA